MSSTMIRIAGAWGTTEALQAGGGDDLVVLLHAAGSGPRALAGLTEALQPFGTRMLAPVLPLDLGTSGSSLARQVAITKACLAHAGTGRRLLFGHSFGGLIGLLAMLEGAEIDAAAFYEPIVLAALDPADPDDVAARAWDRALVDGIAEGMRTSDPTTGIRQFIEAYNEVTWEQLPARARAAIVADAPIMAALTQTVHHLQLGIGNLRRLGAPLLLVNGTGSPDVTQRMTQRLSALLPKGTHQVIAGAGHMGPIMAPVRVARDVGAFLAQGAGQHRK